MTTDIIFGEGWHDLEYDGITDTHFMWSSGESIIHVMNNNIQTIELEFVNSPHNSIDDLIIKIDNVTESKFNLTKELNTIKLFCGGAKTIKLICGTFIPDSIHENGDVRKLGIRLQNVRLYSSTGEYHFKISEIVEPVPTVGILESSNNSMVIPEKNNHGSKNILYIGSDGTSGYAIAAKYIMFNYLQNGYNVTFIPVIVDNSKCNYDNIINNKINNCKSLVYENYDYFIFHFLPDSFKTLYDKFSNSTKYIKNERCKIILQTVWETTKVHPNWVEIMNNFIMDEIWVPSEFNKKVFEDSGVKTKIVIKRYMSYNFIIPTPKDEVVMPSHVKYGNKDITKTFNFYSISSWSDRKNYKNTIREFCKTFTSFDNVSYLVKTTLEDYTIYNKLKVQREFEEVLQEFPDPPDFVLFLENYSDPEINDIHNLGDCYYLLHRGEGLGMASYEAFLNHKPVIVTKFGGQVEYFPENYKYFVDYSLVKVDGMKKALWYSHESEWAEPNYEHARKLLVTAYMAHHV